MKKILSVLVAAAFLVSVGAVAMAAKAPEGKIKVSHFGSDKPAVQLDHKTHTGPCVDCHHNEKDGKYKCGDCHKGEAAGNVPSFKDVAHDLKEKAKCWGCHNKNSATVKKELKCKDCHAE